MKLSQQVINYSLIQEYDYNVLKNSLTLPFRKDEFYTYIAVCEQSNLGFYSNGRVKFIETSQNEIEFYSMHLQLKQKLFTLVQSCLEQKTQGDIDEFLKELLHFAYTQKCSDIHLESMEDSLSIRFRIDGILKHYFLFDKSFQNVISSVIKLYCSLDVTQRRKAMNGRFTFPLDGLNIDFRVSIMPTIYGESIVLRLLDELREYKCLNELGFCLKQLNLLEYRLQSSCGLLLVTGPTGSGKTTTLYAILEYLNTQNKKIVTIEDPIEYQLHGVQQIAVNNNLGLSYHEILKDILRQDPDIIMIGEIRDESSLNIALQAALTGHLVLSTLHTNDAFSTLNRLLDLKAKSYILADTLKMIIAQRLVLKRCKCQDGCECCNFTGFKGRIIISETLNICSRISQMIAKNMKLEDMVRDVHSKGFITMKDDANSKIQMGQTTLKEVQKVLGV